MKAKRVAYWATVVVVVILGATLRSSVLGGTLISDDWDHYAMARKVYPVPRSALDLFKIVARDPSERAVLVRAGRLPWWSDSAIQIAFMRPVSSLFTYADYAWLGADRVPARAHWHSLLWWVCCLIAMAGVLERTLPRPVALAACLLFAIDAAHSLPVAWSASRAELIAFALMIGALWAHVAWSETETETERRRRPYLRSISIVLVWLGVFAGEYALALFGYFVAHALLARRGSVKARLSELLPLTLPLIAYALLHAALGYGASGSSIYTDPLSDTHRYLAALPGRIALLCGDLVFGFSAESWFGPPLWLQTLVAHRILPFDKLPLLQLALAVVGAALLFGAALRTVRSSSDDRQLSWLLVGALLALPPLCGTFAMTRLTVAPALGVDAAIAWLALAAVRCLRADRPVLQRAAAALVVVGIIAVHGWSAALQSYQDSARYAAWSRTEESWVQLAKLDDARLGGRHLIIVSARDIATQFSLPFILQRHGLSMPASSQLLLPTANAPITMARVAPNIVELRSLASAGHSGFRSSAYRLETADFHPGQRFAAPPFTVEVLAVEHGNPTRLRYVFERTLEDPSYLFVYPWPSGLAELALPRVGSSIELPVPALPSIAPPSSHS